MSGDRNYSFFGDNCVCVTLSKGSSLTVNPSVAENGILTSLLPCSCSHTTKDAAVALTNLIDLSTVFSPPRVLVNPSVLWWWRSWMPSGAVLLRTWVWRCLRRLLTRPGSHLPRGELPGAPRRGAWLYLSVPPSLVGMPSHNHSSWESLSCDVSKHEELC